MLLSAYEQGIFPWYNPGEPILWQSPDPRMVIFPENLHVSKSMRKLLESGSFEIVFDGGFEQVIRGCADALRPGQGGTWIGRDIIEAYCEMHRLGLALSCAAYLDGKLAGGCYGLKLSCRNGGSVFFGESMFAAKPNASKAAFLSLAKKLFSGGTAFIDCQIPTDHLRSLGGTQMSRTNFLALLKSTLG
jgi:leucyl/phenylalanyl-tRNA--protein transferase